MIHFATPAIPTYKLPIMEKLNNLLKLNPTCSLFFCIQQRPDGLGRDDQLPGELAALHLGADGLRRNGGRDGVAVAVAPGAAGLLQVQGRIHPGHVRPRGAAAAAAGPGAGAD